MLTKTPPRLSQLRPSRRVREFVPREPAATGADAAHPVPSPASLLAGVGTRGFLGPGTVLAVNLRDRLVLVQWAPAGKTGAIWAHPAMGPATSCQVGDVALVLSQDLATAYLIGLLSPAAAAPDALTTAAGATVKVVAPAGEEVVQVRSRQGDLVVEYHPASGKTVVNVPHGDLEFVTQQGSIALKSAQKISLVAPRIETEAETVVTKATNVYETVEELSQQQAGRTRTIVKGTCLLKARDAFLKTEGDFSIDGKQILLG